MDIGITICTGREGCSDGTLGGFVAVNDALQARLSNPGAALRNAMGEAAVATLTFIGSTAANMAGQLLCGSVAALVTRSPAAVGAAANTCGGAAERAWFAAANGGGWGDMADAAFDPKAMAKDAAIGAAVGQATSWAGKAWNRVFNKAETVAAKAAATVSAAEDSAERIGQRQLFDPPEVAAVPAEVAPVPGVSATKSGPEFVRARPDFTPTANRGGAPGSRPRMDFTVAGKDEVLQRQAMVEADGIARCMDCRAPLTKPRKSERGVTPPSTDAQVDHFDPKANGGSGDPSNGQGLCRTCNQTKSDKVPKP
jgi:hypothetical protein